MNEEVFVGIDISKARLDVASSTGEEFSVGNDEAGHEQLRERFSVAQPRLIVMEATGGLERDLALHLAAAGCEIRVLNPRQVRRFAQATGVLAKTDRLDARVWVQFAERCLTTKTVAVLRRSREGYQRSRRGEDALFKGR
jgi:transposase